MSYREENGKKIVLTTSPSATKHTGAKRGNVTVARLAFPLKTRLLTLRESAELMWRTRET